ncbi:MAG TPA: dynamin family protein [Terriglobales bacterium]|nr:dynamin family protein [Terriglobales bacterium]
MALDKNNPVVEPPNESFVETSDPAEKLHRLADLASTVGAESLSEEASSIADRVSGGRFYVACVGQFKRGKSTLLGALVGEQLLPTGFVPVTAVPTVIRYGEQKSSRARFKGGDWKEIPLSDVHLYVSEEYNPENSKHVEGVEIFTRSRLLKTGMCFVDTPGLGSIFSGNSAATQAFIPHIDAAIVVLGADPPIAGEELALVESVGKQVKDLVVVLNKSDRTTEAERAAAAQFTKKVFRDHLGRDIADIYEVSATEVLSEGRPTRDWARLLDSLNELVVNSGRDLVRTAGERGIKRIGETLLAIIAEERDALVCPIHETEERITRVRETVASSDRSLNDLGFLLTAEQHRLSGHLLEQRKSFETEALPKMQAELRSSLQQLPHRSGRKFKLEAMRHAQEIARKHIIPWLEIEQHHGEQEYKNAVTRFVEAGNEYLHRLSEAGLPQLSRMPNALEADLNFQTKSHFYFHDAVHIARNASPFRILADYALGFVGAYSLLENDALSFLEYLLDRNSSRVQFDILERVQESRSHLEAQIRRLLIEVNRIAEQALDHARLTVAAGNAAVNEQLARLSTLENEVRSIMGLDSASTSIQDGSRQSRSEI